MKTEFSSYAELEREVRALGWDPDLDGGLIEGRDYFTVTEEQCPKTLRTGVEP